jgi:hypothetical protein
MPGGDGTGPLGRGSMTGRARGYCAGFSQPGYERNIGFGRGFGRRFWRRGRGIGYDSYSQNYRNFDVPEFRNIRSYPSEKEEKSFLENMIKDLESRMNDMKNRIKELSKEKKE